MIFSREGLTFRVLDVFHITQTDYRRFNRDRHVGALSFRFRSDAVFDYDGKSLTPGTGSVLYVPPEVDYWRTATYDDMIVIHLEVPDYTTTELECLLPEHPEPIAALFTEIYREWEKHHRDRAYVVTGLFYQLFGELFRLSGHGEDRTARFVRAVTEYLREHFSEPELSVAQVASQFGVSEVYLRRLFREELGKSPKAYLQGIRLQRAAAMLKSGYYSVKKVAHACGYEDEKYFSVLFRKHTGVSPSRYAGSL